MDWRHSKKFLLWLSDKTVYFVKSMYYFDICDFYAFSTKSNMIAYVWRHLSPHFFDKINTIFLYFFKLQIEKLRYYRKNAEMVLESVSLTFYFT